MVDWNWSAYLRARVVLCCTFSVVHEAADPGVIRPNRAQKRYRINFMEINQSMKIYKSFPILCLDGKKMSRCYVCRNVAIVIYL